MKYYVYMWVPVEANSKTNARKQADEWLGKAEERTQREQRQYGILEQVQITDVKESAS